MCGNTRRRASRKSRSVPGSRSAVVRAQVVWAAKRKQRPFSAFISCNATSTVSVISTISSFFFVPMVSVFMLCLLEDLSFTYSLHKHELWALYVLVKVLLKFKLFRDVVQ